MQGSLYMLHKRWLLTNKFNRDKLNLLANYKFSNGDETVVTILEYDGNRRAWVRWEDDFINMVSVEKLELINGENDDR